MSPVAILELEGSERADGCRRLHRLVIDAVVSHLEIPAHEGNLVSELQRLLRSLSVFRLVGLDQRKAYNTRGGGGYSTLTIITSSPGPSRVLQDHILSSGGDVTHTACLSLTASVSLLRSSSNVDPLHVEKKAVGSSRNTVESQLFQCGFARVLLGSMI